MIEKVYYINLDHRTDRRVLIENTLSNLKFNINIIERVPAIFIPNRGASGCLKSHILTIEKFLLTDYNNCLILEDDFSVFNSTHFWESFDSLKSTNLDWDVIQLSYGSEVLETCEHKFLKKVISSQTSASYLLNKKYANLLLENYKEAIFNQEKLSYDAHEWCLDQHWKKIQRFHNWYAFSPKLGYQIASYSDITQNYESYNC